MERAKAELKQAGFNGPVMVECCAPGETTEAVTMNARKNREYLESVFKALDDLVYIGSPTCKRPGVVDIAWITHYFLNELYQIIQAHLRATI